VAHEVKSPENQPQFSKTMMEQYWLDKTKPKKASKMLSKSCHEILNFKKI